VQVVERVWLEAFSPDRHGEMLAAWLQAPHVTRWWGEPAEQLEAALKRPVAGSAHEPSARWLSGSLQTRRYRQSPWQPPWRMQRRSEPSRRLASDEGVRLNTLSMA